MRVPGLIGEKGRSSAEFASDEMDFSIMRGVRVSDRERVDAEFLGEGREAEVDVLAWSECFR